MSSTAASPQIAGTEPKSRSEYTVGWVCALTKEQTAATAMLDQIHLNIPNQPENDDNAYTLGSIGNHNIVIACLPKGIYGSNSATTAATHMVTTFPSIKFGLMVGIGGGIPPKVRLGDVVVSVPVGEYPGVVQWDFGEAQKNGVFKRTGTLNKPPRLLLTAAAELVFAHELDGSKKIPQYLQDVEKRWPRLPPKYTRPSPLIDPLHTPGKSYRTQSRWQAILSMLYDIFLALIGYSLVWDSFAPGIRRAEQTTANTSESTVVGEDQEKHENVHVHYGLIASGNRVVKDADLRDSINKSFGGNILCVEMEAAGLMNHFPCIVIRGICDYADSQENKDWQEYAAMIAAGCAKEFLEHIDPREVEGQQPAKDILNKVLGTVSKTNADVGNIRARLDSKEDADILNWLIPDDYSSQHSSASHKRQPATCQWLLDSHVYKEWLSTRGNTLFCPGIPGAGKTVLTSVVIEDLIARAAESQKIGIAYIYYSYQRKDEQTPANLLRSLLKQLARSQSSLPQVVRDLHKKAQKGRQPSVHDISTALQSVSALYSEVFIVIDALDESASNRDLLDHIFRLRDNNSLNLFATSRHIPEIEAMFESCVKQEIIARDEDVRKYIDGRIAYFPTFLHPNLELQDEVKSAIVEAVEGIFLLAQLYINSLTDKTTVTEMRNALKSLRRRDREPGEAKDRDALDQAYDQAWKRINDQEADFRSLAKKAVSWITCAKRPLTKLELIHALAVQPGDTKLDKDNLRYIRLIVTICEGLVTINEANGIVQLVHYTTQEYFGQRRGLLLLDDIAVTCLTYLSFTTFETGPCSPTDEDFKQQLQLNRLYDYAARNWGYHFQEASIEDESLILNFLGSKTKVSVSSQAMMAPKANFYNQWGFSQASGISGLHLAAWFGSNKAAIILIKNGHDPNIQDTYGNTPLSWAARRGHHAMVQQLLDIEGIDPNIKGTSKDELHEGHESKISVRSFAWDDTWDDERDDIWDAEWDAQNPEPIKTSDSRDVYGTTPLSYAARNGHTETVRLLLAEPRVNPDIKEWKFGFTPLWCAARSGHEAIVQLLLDKGGVDMNHPFNRDGPTLTSFAASMGHTKIVKLLLTQYGTNPNSTNEFGRTPLEEAAYNGHDGVCELLLADGRVDPNSKDASGRTPLFLAAVMGQEAVVGLLLAADKVDPNAANNDGLTPLLIAAGGGHVAVVDLLLRSKRVDVQSVDPSDNSTPLLKAAYYGHEEVVKLLLKHGASPDVEDKMGRTPLFHMARHEPTEAFKALITDKIVELDAEDRYGSTPLSLAVRYGQEESVNLLLATERVNIRTRDNFGRTPLWWATRNGYPHVAKLLLEYAKRKGIYISNNGPPNRSLTDSSWTATCIVCMQYLPCYSSIYACSHCHKDVCWECFELGARCLEASHVLSVRWKQRGERSDVEAKLLRKGLST